MFPNALNVSPSDTTTTSNIGAGVSPMIIITVTLQLILMLFIIFGNILVIVAIFAFQSLWDPTGIFVANLAIADLIIAVTMPLQIAFYFNPALEQDQTMCLLRFDIISFACNASLYSLLCTVVDRYITVVHPLRYSQYMTINTAKILVLGIWTLDIGISCIPLTGLNNWEHAPVCLYELVMEKSFRFFNALHALVLACLMCLIYIRIFTITRKHANQIHTQATVTHETEETVFRSQMNTIISLVVAIYHISWLPFFLVQLTMYNYEDVTIERVTVAHFLVFLGLFNSMVNPIVYAWKNTYYRAIFRKMLRCRNRNAIHPSG